jgi:hypothetical protein
MLFARKADESLVCSEKKIDSFFKPALLRSKTNTTYETSIDEYCLFIVSNKFSTVIYFYLFSSALLISLNFPFICVLSFCLLWLPFASLVRIIA